MCMSVQKKEKIIKQKKRSNIKEQQKNKNNNSYSHFIQPVIAPP